MEKREKEKREKERKGRTKDNPVTFSCIAATPHHSCNGAGLNYINIYIVEK